MNWFPTQPNDCTGILNHLRDLEGDNGGRRVPWGFIVVRCTFADNDLWGRYLAYVRQAVFIKVSQDNSAAEANFLRCRFLLGRIENRDQDGMTIDEAKSRFVTWKNGLPVSRLRGSNDSAVLAQSVYMGPRYEYFMYVDDVVLNKFARAVPATPDGLPERPPRPNDGAVAAIMCADPRPGSGRYPIFDDVPDLEDVHVEGRWQYVDMFHLTRFYQAITTRSHEPDGIYEAFCTLFEPGA